MARSGSRNLNFTRNALVNRSLQTLNLIAKNETAPADMMDFACDVLNMLIKELQTEGIQLWNRKRGYLFTDYQNASYLLGPTGSHCTNDYISTNLNGAAIIGATSLTVDSTSGMTVGDQIGITLSDKSRFWTTIATIPSGTTLTISNAITAAASDNASVCSYTTALPRPLRIFQSTVKRLSLNSEVQIAQIGFDIYFNYPVKNAPGQPSNFFYDETLDNGTLYLYPMPNDTDFVITFIYHEELEDMDSATDDFDFPPQWFNCLRWLLSYELALSYGKIPELDFLAQRALDAKNRMEWFDSDEADVWVEVTNRGY